MNSRTGLPVPQTSIDGFLAMSASTHFRTSAATTCERSGLYESPGPYRFVRIRWIESSPYCFLYACACTAIIFLVRP